MNLLFKMNAFEMGHTTSFMVEPSPPPHKSRFFNGSTQVFTRPGTESQVTPLFVIDGEKSGRGETPGVTYRMFLWSYEAV